MADCPFHTLHDMEAAVFERIRWRKGSDVGKLVKLDHSIPCPRPPTHLRLGEEELRRIAIPTILWTQGFPLRTHGRCATHFHANLEHATVRAHIDYFMFVESGPLLGVQGFAISQAGALLAIGGNWGMPPAGGRVNWPLGVDVGSMLLCIYYPFEARADGFHCDGLSLWEKPSA